MLEKLQNSVESKRSEIKGVIARHLVEQTPSGKEKFRKFLLDCVDCGVAEGKQKSMDEKLE